MTTPKLAVATTDPQSEVVRALADPAFHPDQPASTRETWRPHQPTE
jgi:hypothetical protein